MFLHKEQGETVTLCLFCQKHMHYHHVSSTCQIACQVPGKHKGHSEGAQPMEGGRGPADEDSGSNPNLPLLAQSLEPSPAPLGLVQ